ncbi:hypothetical protein IRP63_14135 (plasmid) [Clostridium botulinum]|uniref:Uncharacterized protein n=1 Tax=Clostridium botulinum C/D str. DC5 TaxID=1443128 RepID=A0A0A0HZM2_CLOBO|nr:hypothetical protein [Clostridium botulinum]KGM93531.1 hypothetical protein Z955_14825 [Clostridium botulinum C/D str. DC5]KOC56869.1 hypothetical protein ADU89_01340 [Clostridium botulinum]KOC57344.1 hypothetical protein ADU90_05880 [Clostridium botulinum]MCD3232575.1 hypothetical protein [Clostridium botulinum D/C]MCD3238496.1 hypothetical protein [Clostridium botulinum D/C]
MTNIKRLSNKEMRKADEFIKAIFDGDQDLVGSLLGLKPIVIGSQEDVLKDLHNDDSDLSKYIKSLSTKINENKLHKEETIKENEYQPQIGDEVLILDSPEGIKNVKGTIVDEVKGTEQFLIQLSELNALYVDKDKVQVVKKKQNIEEINRLKNIITKGETKRKILIEDIENITQEIHDLEECKLKTQEKLSTVSKSLEQYKQQLEQLEGR